MTHNTPATVPLTLDLAALAALSDLLDMNDDLDTLAEAGIDLAAYDRLRYAVAAALAH